MYKPITFSHNLFHSKYDFLHSIIHITPTGLSIYIKPFRNDKF